MKNLKNLTPKEIEKYLAEAYKDLTEATQLLDIIEDVEEEDLPDTVEKLEKQVESMENAQSTMSTTEKVLHLRSVDPNLPAVEIARLLDVTRERVRQILSTAGLDTDVRKKILEEKLKEYKCQGCGGPLSAINRKYCSRDCFYNSIKATWIYFPCTNCGITVQIRGSMQKVRVSRGNKRTFCTRDCFHQWRENNPKIWRTPVK